MEILMLRRGAGSGDPNAAERMVSSPTASATVVCNFWKDFELESFRGRLDEQGLAIAEHQESSLKSRRKLAETTRDFKRHAAPEVVADVGPLLKSYQEEIDRLTSRAKFGESAFLDVYQRLYEAPDPAPALNSALGTASRAAELEAQTRKMAQELAEYKSESNQLKNQDLTIRKLEERIRSLDAQLEEKDRQLGEAKEHAAAESDARALAEMQERESALTEALGEARASLANMQRLHQVTQNQLFSMQARTEDERAGMQSEMEIATAEMDRAHQRLVALEREKEVLLSQAGGAPAAVAEDERKRAAEDQLRNELHTQRELASRLHAEVAALQQTLEGEQATWQSRCEGLRSALQAQEAHAAALEQEISTRPTAKQVDELRQTIRILQAVGYNAMEAEDRHDGQNGASSTPLGQAGSLEALLLEKNRHLEHELTMARLKVAEATGEAEAASASAAELSAEVAAQKALIARLEEDLLAAEKQADGGKASRTGEEGCSGRDMDGLLDESGEAGGSGRTMVGVLVSQRDRFRKRAQELEEELAQARAESSGLRQDLEASRADNVALVERLRYVQGYQAQTRRKGDMEKGEVETRYASAYEEKLNPFSDFRTRERETRRRQMHVADRVMFEFGQIISGSRFARLFVFAYILFLHFLIFWVLARWSHRHSGQVLCAGGAAPDAAHALGGAVHAVRSAMHTGSDIPIDASFHQATLSTGA
ncbi:hypothetical protein WJX72_004650 [[Myrmecia] bisecta]|uniref:Protein CASP n=1 Tax=[Myrmecia] bisecta TaxID=41462 RepID=A0AAW1P1M6_9CHLO